MKKNLFTTIKCFLLLLCSLTSVAWADGFQGIPWGSTPADVIKKYPSAREELQSQELLMSCKDVNGETYKCSVPTYSCQNHGVRCFPHLKLRNYMVGNIAFDVSFEFSKQNQLAEVSLSYQNPITDANISSIKPVFDKLLYNLQQKYGNPTQHEKYSEQIGMQCVIREMCNAFGSTQWQTNNTNIRLLLSGQFDPKTRTFVDIGGKPRLTILYHPKINDTASKL